MLLFLGYFLGTAVILAFFGLCVWQGVACYNLLKRGYKLKMYDIVTSSMLMLLCYGAFVFGDCCVARMLYGRTGRELTETISAKLPHNRIVAKEAVKDDGKTIIYTETDDVTPKVWNEIQVGHTYHIILRGHIVSGYKAVRVVEVKTQPIPDNL